MKDYRYFGVYARNEWEDDIDWKAKRLQFLWDVRRYYGDEYHDLKMFDEKNAFYRINDNEVSRLAAKYDRYGDGDLEKFSQLTNRECVEKFIELLKLKRSNKNEFMKKCNSNLFCFLKEQRYEEMKEAMQYDEYLREEYDSLYE